MTKNVIDYQHFIELLYLLVKKDFCVRYKNSLLGYLWAVANPFAFALVYYVAFKVIMRVEIPNYSIFLLTGIFPWTWFTNSIVLATSSYRNNATLVKRVNLPRAALPLSNVVHEMIHFCFAIPVLILFIKFTGCEFYISWLWQLPGMIFLQLSMVYPVALLLALANVYVHDVEYLVGIGLSMLFFFTPIVYPSSMVPEVYREYFEMSPLVGLIDNWRNMFLYGTLDKNSFLYCSLISILVASIAAFFYVRSSAKIGELL
jgi:lipopolysaccharide transport system permease protein